MSKPLPGREIALLASDTGVHRAFRWLHLHQLQLQQWQMEFLGIPAPTFHEGARALWFQQKLREIGLKEAHIDVAGNAVALLGTPGQVDGSAILLSAHLDTVFETNVPCLPHVDGARIFCPGACDNGAGLTALLALAAVAQEAGLALPCPVVFAANVGEEGEGDLRGIRHLFDHSPYGVRLAAAIALEGAGNAIVVDRALGSRRLRVTVEGAGGHSWADARRPNPILALSAAILAVTQLPLPSHPRTILNAGTFHGGTSVNSVPQSAVAQLDLRSTSEGELDRLEAEIVRTLSAAVESTTRGGSEGDRLLLRVERIGVRPVGALGPETPLYQGLRAVDRHLGIATDSRIGSTDANLPLSRGIPALAIGCGGTGGGLHSTAEWYDPTGRELALRRILLLLLHTCHAASSHTNG